MSNTENLKWLFELAENIRSNDTFVIRQNLVDQLDLLVYLNETLVEEKAKVDEHESLSEQLLIKFYLHGLSIIRISEGYILESKFYDNQKLSSVKFIDISSLLTIGRAQLETLLMYNHIYVNTKDVEEQKLRYYAWIYTALLQRKDAKASSPEAKKQKERDSIKIEELKTKITNSPHFRLLKPNQQQSLIQNGSPKLFKHWKTIFNESNYPENGMFYKLYYLLSAYAHSEGLSAIQMKSAKQILHTKENLEYIYLQTLASLIMTSSMIKNIVEKFPTIENRYNFIDEKIKYNVNFYAELGKGNEKV